MAFTVPPAVATIICIRSLHPTITVQCYAHFGSSANRLFRSRGCVNIVIRPSGVRGQRCGERSQIQLDTAFVRISEIEHFAHSMVTGTVKRDSCLNQPTEGIDQISTCRIQDRQMIKFGDGGKTPRFPRYSIRYEGGNRLQK